MVIWFATGNEHKRGELSALLPGHEVRIPKDAGLAFDPEETGATFVENALIKARALWDLVKAPVLADDSGLAVDALGGRPGIYSARYGEDLAKERGVPFDASFRNQLLLSELEGKTQRTARFVCAMVLMREPERFAIVQETLEGEIAHAPAGVGGFGYDPLVYLADRACSVAELSEAEKNGLSHRGKAVAEIKRLLEDSPFKA